ncbi:hypothetical protein [Streptomyces brevispora]|uniref:hypothetical protein n=1 Tax=Streptomyces brevispora TaxID=887462 RepID=UPI002E2F9C68|nr:hypothetical protein [Streptomyces brevispora]
MKANELIERAGRKPPPASPHAPRCWWPLRKGAGSQHTKAQDLGIRIAAPEEFAELIEEYLPSEV